MSAYLSYELPVKRLTKTSVLPDKANLFDAGLDLYCDEKEVVTLAPGERKLFSTGISMAIPKGFVGLIWPRSGHAVKKGIDTLAGVVDSPYRGEVKVLLINESNGYQTFAPGDKIAQMIIQHAPDFTPTEVDDLDNTSRGDSGFGSSGQ
jgi:dUTP pyrophosphatase